MDLEKVEWEEVQDAKQVEFKVVGDVFIGVLIESAPKQEKSNSRYYFENSEGRHLVWGTTILDQKLSQVEPGTPVRIEFKEEKKLEGGRTLKIFKVSTPKPEEKKADDTGDQGDHRVEQEEVQDD